jgi:hypothetical protein
MGARNWVGIGLPYWPTRLHRLAESIPCKRFLGSLIPCCTEEKKRGEIFLVCCIKEFRSDRVQSHCIEERRPNEKMGEYVLFRHILGGKFSHRWICTQYVQDFFKQCGRKGREGKRPDPVSVNLFRSPGIDSQPGGPIRQPYLSYWPARLHRLAESIPRNWFLGSLNVYKYGLSKGMCVCVCGWFPAVKTLAKIQLEQISQVDIGFL